MQLNKLNKSTGKSKKRLGRGYGSGKGGHTSSRGSKGQRSRGKVHQWFEGGQLPLVKRLPFHRGKSRFKSLKKTTIILNLKDLTNFPKNSTVNINSLAKRGLVSKRLAQIYGVKILGSGKIAKPLKISLPISKSAAKAIKKAGGTVHAQSTDSIN